MTEPVLQGFVVEARLRKEHLDVSLIASSKEAAIMRTRVTLVHSRRNLAWMHAEYTVVETITLDEFRARRADGRA